MKRPRRILVVDDNEEILLVVRKILQCEGYDVSTASTGAEALEKTAAEAVDLVVLDLMLPDIDGLEVCRRLRADPETSAVMIVMLTARGAPEHRIEGYDAGADDYVDKPFHREEFLARIRAALRLKSLRDSLEERSRQLIESQHALVRREKMATVGLLAAGLAHEFNNIMSGIAGCAQMARKNQAFVPTLIEVALTQGKRAAEIIEALRTFVHPQEATFVPVAFKEVVESVRCLVRKELERREVELRVSIPRDLPPLRGVPGQLQQILLNLVLNAAHAITNGGWIEISARRGENGIEIRVADNGCGIPPEAMDRIFDPFFTTKGSLAGGELPGTGLGLTVVYNLVKAHDGSIEVESEPGKGTVFKVSLPVA